MAEDLLSRKIFKEFNRTAQFRFKYLPFLRVNESMREPVGPNFMPRRLDALHDGGKFLRDIPEHKKGRRDTGVVQNPQQLITDRLYPVLETIPFGIRDLQPLIPIFKIYGQGICYGHTSHIFICQNLLSVLYGYFNINPTPVQWKDCKKQLVNPFDISFRGHLRG